MIPKIVFIASYPQSLLNFRLDLMKAFLANGYCVSVIAPPDEAVATKLANFKINYHPIAIQRNGLNPFADFNLIRQLIKILRAEQALAVFSYTIKPVIYGSIAAKLAGISHIYSMITGTGYVFLNHNFKSRVVGLIARRLFRIALYFNQLVFFQNPDNCNFFKKSKIISAKKNTAIINGSGINCDEFMPAPYPSAISFLMIARFLYDKGIREYIEAAKILKNRYPHIVFKLVGWIDTNPNSISEHELSRWIQEGIIQYLGKLADVKSAISNASVYVLPSYHEGTPRTVLEAMAMARPVVTTDAPGCRETVVPNYNGFLVPVKDIEKLVMAMELFIKFPNKIAEMGAASRKLAIEKYDVNKVNHHILKAMGVSQSF